ncbi:hypothetical protein HZH66_000942 [Vespula vulgaris]|uniref:Uncharacterized protein n=1 Tax=Vespula vulgaris TaxID=7454 RepID=A0A834KU58_VESVU|nr:hypothetical protein HZH66_000942 [Vespula vulgaris]
MVKISHRFASLVYQITAFREVEITARRFALRCTGPCDYRSSEAIVPQTFRGRHSLEWTKLCATRVVVNGAGHEKNIFKIYLSKVHGKVYGTLHYTWQGPSTFSKIQMTLRLPLDHVLENHVDT